MVTDPRDNPKTDVDIAIGSALVLTLVLGLLGNIVGFIYFWPRREKTALNRLYIGIVVVDILTCILTIPVIASLFNNREVMLFTSPAFCGTWAVITCWLLRLSTFLVTVLSVTTTVAMVCPHIQVELSSILATTTGYATVLLTLDGAFFATGWIKGAYYKELVLCDYAPTEHAQSARAMVFIFVTFQTEVLLPPVVLFVSLIISVISLSCSRTTARNNDQAEFSRASVSVAMFTTVSILCNIPLIIFQIFPVLAYFDESRAERTMTWINRNYGYLLLRYFPYVLNATLNPIFYLIRMPGHKEQIIHFLQKINERRR